MAQGIFFFIVGPSGAGKDALIEGARARLGNSGRYVFAQRTITRPSTAPGEDHHGVSEAEFDALLRQGQFLMTWQAHGLRYGLPASLRQQLADGVNVIANGSRTMIRELAGKVPRLVVIDVHAPVEVLAARILGRGREDAQAARERLLRSVEPLPADIETLQVANDGTLEEGVERFVATLEKTSQRLRARRLPLATGRERLAWLPAHGQAVQADDYLGEAKVDLLAGERAVSAQVYKVLDPTWLADGEIGLCEETFRALGIEEGTSIALRRTPSPASRQALRKKVGGGELGQDEYDMLIRDIVDGRYSEGEISAFLVTATRHLSDPEVLALAWVRARYATPLRWAAPIVVDKHSMGGIPGSRITLIVVPIIAAHGLAMPKTSSRAITSAAGTADAMETVARVDLTAADVARCVAQTNACIAWNGRLNHSEVDDVMNAITRPLGIDSNRWSVASILSKKLAAGSTHVIVDLPYGERTKLKTQADAQALGELFERIGHGLGLTVKAFATDGKAPVGRGIGPALEVRDVRWVLGNHAQAPADLRAKALFFASHILAWDPAVGNVERGLALAERLLSSGQALAAFERIIDAQGRREPILPGPLTRHIAAPRSGTVHSIDGWTIAGIARRAGAPEDKSAGIDLHCALGQPVQAGDTLYTLHASHALELEAAALLAQMDNGVVIE
ncbi:phosphonate metabolism protein/1,5-bisphosphokinase (PRPP-forming) PhnN [Pseudomonas typographi]|uniref:phosphonate metabolism protein/1,5-bisphosphokinase (PRPP-forming) PhnN n=1 Tax=Pseudomonas typographi TaxID=2715964 RepID=UPI001682611E|nr:phosphonate metabolism protein/1,5-bisphosphokinase (PRPP-forming) PhnN [Pseudomonas typographi]MBD1587177.1 phosphonate metabolism protein/1,5-bisphosphokinase (PRPP-forming) PhnN [Pseudomonas typographi]